MPEGIHWVNGHSRVVGHGNSSTSYDAKVWVKHFMVLRAGGRLLEIAGGQLHYDGTRSADRTRNFENELVFAPRYLFFQANRDDKVTLEFCLDVDTAANEDGIAIVVIDAFGFLANLTNDLDTFMVKND
jgi:hypothetical protein